MAAQIVPGIYPVRLAAPVAAKLPQSLPVVLLEGLAAMAAVPSECRHTSAESVGLNLLRDAFQRPVMSQIRLGRSQ